MKGRKLIFSTRTADCYADSDESGFQRTWRWEMKFPLELGSESAESFQQRLALIGMPGLPRLPITDHGIDGRGIGFVSLLHRDMQPLNLQRLDNPAAIFINIVETVAKFHEQGVVLGDICGVSFVLDGTGRVLLSAMLGSYDYSARGTSLIPPRETLFYIAPEQRVVASPTASCDIYALGVMGYRLITGRFPQGNKPERFLDQSLVEHALAPSELVANCPAWIDPVIAKCIETDVSKRYQSCQELLADIQNENRIPVAGKWLRRNKTVHFNMPGLGITLDNSVARFSERPTRIFLLSLLLVIAGVLAFIVSTRRDEQLKLEALQVAVINTDKIDGDEIDVAERREKIIKQIAAGDDPVSKFVLGSLATSENNPQAKQEAAEGLIRYFDRRGKKYIVSALQWLLTRPADQLPSKEQIRLVLEICDERYSPAKRVEKLKVLHGQDPLKASVFVAALVLGKEIDGVSNILKQWLHEISDNSSEVFYTPVALVLGSDQLRSIFSKHITTLVSELHPEETTKLLELQKGTESEFILHLAARSKNENLYPAFQEIVVEQIMAVAGRRDQELTGVYVRALSGKLQSADLAKLSPCSDDTMAAALLSLYMLSNDPTMSEPYLKAMRQCLPKDPLAANLLSNNLQKPSSLLNALIIIALGSKTEYAELDQAISTIISAPSRDDILATIFAHGDSQLIGLTLERVGGALASDYLLSLAKHPNPEVRSRVVAILVHRNDLSIEQPLAELMAEEQDKSVLAQYRSAAEKR